ncbi:YfhD family protein [Pullulanibacillus sp. KACC 23026]|uniref:YfhD family protein n=1 Tax=Pullulanibacillus sp. KACC 23026 TaxID=3028315 RepID=UPI0023B0CDC4|nr:YfhD family protein [Pullulanibacillus sp. KACC 23026]WEG14387.1 YfhD family protein [Pullulanibacillus sp. KACC 23026]
MGRQHKTRVNRDGNSTTLPQTPKQLKRPYDQGEELELARELDEVYDLKARQGYSPTEVERKKEKH